MRKDNTELGVKIMEGYKKVTYGFVTQTFVVRDGVLVCSEQEFEAGTDCDYLNADGTEMNDIPETEGYQNYEMRSPDGGDNVDDRWSITDVQDRYKNEDDEDDDNKEPLSDDVARRILHLCMDKMDANVGINWDMIDYWTNEVLNPDSRVNEKR
jgi:hypothetical protein